MKCRQRERENRSGVEEYLLKCKKKKKTEVGNCVASSATCSRIQQIIAVVLIYDEKQNTKYQRLRVQDVDAVHVDEDIYLLRELERVRLRVWLAGERGTAKVLEARRLLQEPARQ